MNKAEGILTLLEELFISKGRKLTDDVAKVWAKHLAPYPDDRIIFAIQKEIKSPNQFPTIGGLIENIEPENNTKSIVLGAWDMIIQHIRDGKIETIPQRYRKVVNSLFGGFYELRYGNEYRVNAMKKDFMTYGIKTIEDREREKQIKLINQGAKIAIK